MGKKTPEKTEDEYFEGLKITNKPLSKNVDPKTLMQEIELPNYNTENITEDAINLGVQLKGNTKAIEQLKARESEYRAKIAKLKKQPIVEVFDEMQRLGKVAALYREAHEVATGKAEPGTLYQKGNIQWYSKLQNLVASKMPNKADPQTVLNLINKGGIKVEEIKYSGLNEFLKGKRNVTKDELLSHLIENQVQIEEVVKGGNSEITVDDLSDWKGAVILDEYEDGDEKWVDFGKFQGEEYRVEYYFTEDQLIYDDGTKKDAEDYNWENADITITKDDGEEIGTPGTKFSQYVEPGGENYRELLLTLPSKTNELRLQELMQKKREGTNTKEDDAEFELLDKKAGIDYVGGHFDEPNILAHIRFNERTDADGNKVLFIEEIQSDWHQEGRKKGYRGDISDEDAINWVKKYGDVKDLERLSLSQIKKEIKSSGVPDAPFKKTWHELAMKRAIRWATENGFDKVAWTTGEMQAERYDLSKQVDNISWNKKTYELNAEKGEEVVISEKKVSPDKLEDYVGKELAQKLIDSEPNQAGYTYLSGIDLKVGGEGMKGFYDKILPSFARKYGQKVWSKG